MSEPSAGDNVLVIAEVAQAHDGSLGTAHAFIDLVAEAGANIVKFQTHIASAESTPHEQWRVPFSFQDESRYHYWKRMEFAEEHWHGLRRHASEVGLGFMSSAFSTEAFELLQRVGVDGWKVASGEVDNAPLLDRMSATGLPVFLSTGMSSLTEIDRAVHSIRQHGLQPTVLQCTSMYPSPSHRIGLNLIADFRARWGCPVGLSDHSGTIWPSIGAVALGADVIEVHITLSRAAFGPDVDSSVTPAEFQELVRGVRYLAKARANPVDKDRMADELGLVRSLFKKSIVVRHELPAGHVLTSSDLSAKKPGTGISAERLSEFVGLTLARPVKCDQLLSEDDLEETVPVAD